MAAISFSKNFISTLKSFLPVNCGIPESLRNSVSPQYLVQILSVNPFYEAEYGVTNAEMAKRNTTEVWGYLQEKIKINIKSDWEGVSDIFGGVDKVADTAVQGVTTLASTMGFGSGPRSLVSQAGSRRKWSGSSPVQISLQLKFEAVEDISKEVLQPCLALQQLCAPRQGKGTGGFFLIPPGPSPFKLGEGDPLGEMTEINIGNFLTLKSVIINDVVVTYETRMSSIGPIGATADITLSSYEMLTKQGLAEMYHQTGITQSATTRAGSFAKTENPFTATAKVVDLGRIIISK